MVAWMPPAPPPHPPIDVPPLLARLVDDAALFPPRAAPMADAVAGYLAHRRGPYAGVLGHFLCPVSRLAELVAQLRRTPPGKPVALSLIADTGLGGLPKAVSTAQDNDSLLVVRMVEVPAPSDVDATWLVQLTEFVPDDVVQVVEPRRGRPDWLEGVRRVAEAGCWPKLRCGGRSVEWFPSVDEIADFLAVVCAAERSFKATHGLQHAVRQRDAAGLTHHGFLNVLVATARALDNGDVRGALGSTDGAGLAAEARGLSDAAAKAVREVFACYGSYRMADPVADLVKLGLLRSPRCA